MDGLAQLRQSLTRYGDIPAPEWKFLCDHLSVRQFGRRALLVRPGDEPGAFHFLTDGLVRLYYTTADGQEVIKSFAEEGRMTGPLLAWLAGEASPLAIEAVEPTRALALPVALVNTLRRRDPVWERVVGGYLRSLAHETEARNVELLLYTGKQRYRRFAERQPDLHARLPLNQIAAYLRMSAVSLSRIRRELRLTNVKATVD